jgi:hypothetical protein
MSNDEIDKKKKLKKESLKRPNLNPDNFQNL